MAAPVVLVHGWGGSFRNTWQKSGFTALLDDADRTVIGIDLLGHGDAPKPHEPDAYADLTSRISESLPDEPVDAVGFSLGALTLLRLACREPNRFNRLVLAGIGENVFSNDTIGTDKIVAALDGDGETEDNVARLFVQYASQPGNDRRALAAVMRRPSRGPFTEDELAAVTCPTLVAIGDLDFAGPGDRLAAALPNARLVTLRKVDHFATPEAFSFIDATLEFLDAIPRMTDAEVDTEVDAAIAVLRRGGLVGIPTETVYGLAADASNEMAVRRIFTVKQRPPDHPLIVHIGSVDHLDDWAASVPPAAARLADVCWPGPLTLLLPKRDHVLPVVTGGRDTVGVRVPAHRLTLRLLDRFGGGLAAPSANHFGHVSPTTAQHVRDDLGSDVDLVLDGGACPIGVESTIVDCTVSPPQILRPGGIPNEEIARLLDAEPATPTGPSRASGMLASHYAPRSRVEVVDTRAAADRRAAELAASGERVDVLDPTDDLVVAAQQLYVWLRDADARRLDTIVAVLPPQRGLGHAIRDRLIKASAAHGHEQ